jgi:hypothetical protein
VAAAASANVVATEVTGGLSAPNRNFMHLKSRRSTTQSAISDLVAAHTKDPTVMPTPNRAQILAELFRNWKLARQFDELENAIQEASERTERRNDAQRQTEIDLPLKLQFRGRVVWRYGAYGVESENSVCCLIGAVSMEHQATPGSQHCRRYGLSGESVEPRVLTLFHPMVLEQALEL